MALVYDATATGTASATSLTYAHTCTGSNLILFVGFSTYDAAEVVTTVTYNGVAMTQANKKASAAGDRWSYLYYLIAPATGANNIVISRSNSGSINSCSTSYTGAKQSSQPDSSNTNSVLSDTTLTYSTTVVASNCWLVAWSDGANTAGAGTTTRNTSGSASGIGDSNGTVSTGSQSLIFTVGGAGQIEGVIASIAPFVAAEGVGFFAFL